MFVLSQMKDTVRIPPWLFHLNFNDAVIEALNKKLANKVSHDKGDNSNIVHDITKGDNSDNDNLTDLIVISGE